MSEFSVKQERISSLLDERGLDALLLRRVSSFAWATCGAASYVNLSATEGAASLLLTPSGRYVITDNVEATRLTQEEHLPEQGWEMRVHDWWEAPDVVSALAKRLQLGSDVPYPGATDIYEELVRLRVNLQPEEIERFREVARLCGETVESVARQVRPGMTEVQIAGLQDYEARSRGMQAPVNLIGTDERIFRFRHPHPTEKKLERYALLGFCGRRYGLVCAVSRLVHFGPVPGELRKKADALARVDAAFIDATRPGRKLSEVFEAGVRAYADVGYPDEWKQHTQGGTSAYEAREYLAAPSATEPVLAGQMYGWNPSITGTKSEDTILVTDEGQEILTSTPGWPLIQVSIGGREIPRPDILVLE